MLAVFLAYCMQLLYRPWGRVNCLLHVRRQLKLDFPGRKAVLSALFKSEQREFNRLRARLMELESVERSLTDEHLRSEKLASRVTALEKELAASTKALEVGDKNYFIDLLEGKTEGISLAGLRPKFG